MKILVLYAPNNDNQQLPDGIFNTVTPIYACPKKTLTHPTNNKNTHSTNYKDSKICKGKKYLDSVLKSPIFVLFS